MSAPSDFARAQLLKFGWKEGKGLGKQEDGITSAIKPKLKFNKHGIGHDSGLEYKRFWWDQVYNKAASNVVVIENNDEVSVNIMQNKANSKKRKHSCQESSLNQLFIKSEILENNGKSVPVNLDPQPDEENSTANFRLPDDEIFKKCKGRTAHKAARHGHKMSAKLLRLKEQEESFAGSKESRLNVLALKKIKKT